MTALIGIDPGVTTGFALKRDGILETVTSFTAVQAEQVVLSEHNSGQIIVYVEDARMQGYLPPSMRGGTGRLQNVGQVKRDSGRWEEFLIYHNIPHVLVSPRSNRYKKCKIELFEKLTGWTKRSNEHGRDAACLLIGR